MGASSGWIVSGEDEARIAHKAKMQEVAKSIFGGDTFPLWLIDLLLNWSFEVRTSHSIEQMLPTKVELWERLSEIEKTAAKLLEILRSPMTAGFLARVC